MEKDVYFSNYVLSFLEAIENIGYDAPGKVNTTHPVRTNLFSHISRFPYQEREYIRTRHKCMLNLSIRPEQKSSVLVKDMLKRFRKPGNLVKGGSPVTLSAAKSAWFSRRMKCF